MPTAYLTREVCFSAAHRYHRPEWSEEQNRARFGACTREHGHRYRLEVTVGGSVDEQTGFAVDLAALDALLRREVTDVFDHRHINQAVPDFAAGARIPSTENLLLYLWPRIRDGLPAGARLSRLRLEEDEGLYAELHERDMER